MAKGAVSDELARDGEAEALQDEKQTIQKNKNTDIRARQRAIGRELRRMCDEIAREQIPEDFLELLRQLDAKNENPKNEAK
ncbi:MAG: NepR family anti-sigma factor [Micropepsaceae bacterium]